jgi:hypothetical protein
MGVGGWVGGGGVSGGEAGGRVGGRVWAPNGTRLSAHSHFTGTKKLGKSKAQPPPTSPSNEYARIQTLRTGLYNHR